MSATVPRDVMEIWNQRRIPVVVRLPGDPIRVRLPYDAGNMEWLRNDRRSRPEWSKQRERWSIPRAWFDDTVKRTIERFGQVYVIQPYREMEKCARPCWEAKGFECECSCKGEFHGSQDPTGWREITETFAVRWGDRQYACRLIKRRTRPT